MERVSLAQIVRALRATGVRPGELVNVHSRLYSIGVVDGMPTDQIPALYLRAFREVLGASGTLVVPTYTTSFGRYGTPFLLETSPSEMGVFSEHVRRTAGALRTLHPIQSLAALGAHAEALTDNHPRWNVGYDTIWDRMLQRGGKIVTIGLPPWFALSLMHQAELLACVPYLYHKILRGDIYAAGVRIPDDFFIAVRYLQYRVVYDSAQLQRDLTASGAVTQVPLGGSAVWSLSMPAVFDIGMRGLRRDPYYLLREAPSFVIGEIPCDGTTIEREGAPPTALYFRR